LKFHHVHRSHRKRPITQSEIFLLTPTLTVSALKFPNSDFDSLGNSVGKPSRVFAEKKDLAGDSGAESPNATSAKTLA
jgi:hypothetical protein